MKYLKRFESYYDRREKREEPLHEAGNELRTTFDILGLNLWQRSNSININLQ